MHILHKTFYPDFSVLPQSTFTRALVRHLSRPRRFRLPRKVRRSSRPIQDRNSRDERLTEWIDRTVPGHWEGRLDREPCHRRGHRAPGFHVHIETQPAQLRRSLLYDQGLGIREPRLFTKQTKMRVDCVQSRPWEWGMKKNNSRLLHQSLSTCIRLNQIMRKMTVPLFYVFHRVGVPATRCSSCAPCATPPGPASGTCRSASRAVVSGCRRPPCIRRAPPSLRRVWHRAAYGPARV